MDVGTRTPLQVSTHAQKIFQRVVESENTDSKSNRSKKGGTFREKQRMNQHNFSTKGPIMCQDHHDFVTSVYEPEVRHLHDNTVVHLVDTLGKI